MQDAPIGKSSSARTRVSQLIREAGELFTVADVARILKISSVEAARSLSRWRKQGWFVRIKRGLYAAVPIEAETSDRALESPWTLVPKLFGNAYIGGWSAAEHWDLTEQLFRDICVFTAQPVGRRKQVFHNVPFMVMHAPIENHFGTTAIWRMETKVLVSDPARTMIDMLSNPAVGGGIQHVIDCLRQYFENADFKHDLLVEYGDRLGNRAVFKRLGFLTSNLLGEEHPLVAACASRLSKGNAQLDPSLKGAELITRWRLFVHSSTTLIGSSR
jgi:predicted transcriptional regulator of viral defense system